MSWADLRKRRCCQGERRHKKPGQPRTFYLKLHRDFLLSTPFSGYVTTQASCQMTLPNFGVFFSALEKLPEI